MTHEFFREVPLYHSVTFDAKDSWNRPGVGRLAGVVF